MCRGFILAMRGRRNEALTFCLDLVEDGHFQS